MQLLCKVTFGRAVEHANYAANVVAEAIHSHTAAKNLLLLP